MDPVNWQQRYLDQDTPWDKGRNHPMTTMASRHFIPGDILIPGCGRGWDARALRDDSADGWVIGVDLSALAITEAQKLHGNERLVWYEDDLFRDEEDERFSNVKNAWEHTCLCALPPAMRLQYVKRVAKLLPDGGMLCGVFFTHMNDEGDGPPWNTPPEELIRLYQPYFDILSLENSVVSFAGRENEESFLVMRRRI